MPFSARFSLTTRPKIATPYLKGWHEFGHSPSPGPPSWVFSIALSYLLALCISLFNFADRPCPDENARSSKCKNSVDPEEVCKYLSNARLSKATCYRLCFYTVPLAASWAGGGRLGSMGSLEKQPLNPSRIRVVGGGLI